MKRWAIITVGLYLVVALIVTVPFALVLASEIESARVIDVFGAWGYWLWIGVSVVSQILLLAVPVAVSERRPRSRRHVLVPVITAASLLMLVYVAAAVSLIAGIWGDSGAELPWIDLWGNPALAAVGYLILPWAIWALVFWRFAMRDDPEALTRRLMRWLLRGSILELLIAVPSHIATRHRHDCCAPMASFWGIVTGVTVMLVSFGPGVFFLFAERMRRRQPAISSRPPSA